MLAAQTHCAEDPPVMTLQTVIPFGSSLFPLRAALAITPGIDRHGLAIPDNGGGNKSNNKCFSQQWRLDANGPETALPAFDQRNARQCCTAVLR